LTGDRGRFETWGSGLVTSCLIPGAQGFEPVGGTPEEFSAYIKSELVKWAKVVKDANVRVD
jgi:hypothetical protein